MRFVALLLVGVLFASPVLASGGCYSQQEFEADRGLRLHADVEVITLTCKYSTRGQPLQKAYNSFVRRHSAQIRKWEMTIAGAYGGDGIGRNEAIDNFRTWLANQKSNEAATMGPRAFCKQWADFVGYANSLTDAQMMYYINESDSSRPTKRPPC
jgi:hypothetical protein